MTQDISHTEASLALETVQQRRDDVLAELNVPWWYWPGLAAGWVGLGVLADFGPAWSSTVVTIAFGAAHASVGPRVLTGRHPSTLLSIRNDVVSHRIPALIIGFLVVMVALTVAIALVLNADGARHPATLAGAIVGALVLTAGPQLMHQLRAWARRQRTA